MMTEKINFEKSNGLVPVIIQHYLSLHVLMLGYMDKEALQKTQKEQIVTFFSRTKNRLWTKGETSGNYLEVKELTIDCDQDTILIKVNPKGPTCHTGTNSCFGNTSSKGFLYELENTIQQRINEQQEDSYTYKLFQKGINKIAQKVGEEAVELVIEAKDQNDSLFKNEAADLLYHFLVLLQTKNMTLQEVELLLQKRSKG